MAMKTTIILFLTSLAAVAQYRVVVPGTGNQSAFIAENTTPSQGTCYELDTPTTGGTPFLGGKICGKILPDGGGLTFPTTNTIFFELPCDLNGCTIDAAFIKANQFQFRQWASMSSNVNGQAMFGSNAYLDFNSPNTIRAANTQSSLFGANAIFLNSLGDRSIIFARYNAATTADQPIVMTESMRIDTNGNLVPGQDNIYTNGTQSKVWQNTYTANLSLGRAASLQGSAAFYNPTNSSFFQMTGTNTATGGGDLAVGNFIGPDAIYPANPSTDLGFSASRFRKIWVRDIDISGTCTGCSAGAGANTALSNLITTSINQSLLFDTDNSYNIGSNTKQLSNIYSTTFIAGNATGRPGILDIYNGTSSIPNILIGTNTTGNSDIQIGPFLQTGWAFYPISTNVGDLGTTGNHWRTLNVNNINAGGNAGLTTTKTVRAAGGAADCTLIYTAGVLTGGTC